jgi:glycosyltransferase involved in cell wall biosynthesis
VSAPLVSCIVPVFNGERYLAEAIESILAQGHRPLEVIVVDDGSTDTTPEVARSFGDAVRYLRQDNAGCAAARNRGIEVARGEYIAFQDADDVWSRDKLSRQLARFAARPELDYCVTHVQNFWVAELEAEAERLRDHPRARALPGYVAQALLARRSLFASVGGFDPAVRLAESIDWFMRADRSGAVSELLPEVLVFRRLHASNSTRHGASEAQEAVLRLLKRRLDARRGGRDG